MLKDTLKAIGVVALEAAVLVVLVMVIGLALSQRSRNDPAWVTSQAQRLGVTSEQGQAAVAMAQSSKLMSEADAIRMDATGRLLWLTMELIGCATLVSGIVTGIFLLARQSRR